MTICNTICSLMLTCSGWVKECVDEEHIVLQYELFITAKEKKKYNFKLACSYLPLLTKYILKIYNKNI